MKNIIKLTLLALLSVFLFTGCGDKVIIENGEVGKQITGSGLEKEIRNPGALRMDSCMFTACPKLVRLTVAETSKTIPGKFFINKSDLDLTLDLKLQYSVKRDEKSINEVFDRVKGIEDTHNSRQLIIPEEKVYITFIDPVLRDTVRVSLNNYTIEEMISNLTEVRKFVENEVRKQLANTPITIVNLTFGKIGWPDSIIKAKEDFAKIEIEKATKMKAMAAELEIMTKQFELDKKRAEMTLQVDKIISDKMNDNLKSYMLLDGIRKSAENGTPWAITGSDVIFRETNQK